MKDMTFHPLSEHPEMILKNNPSSSSPSEAYFSAVFHHTTILMIVLNECCEYTYLSPNMVRITGEENNFLLGKKFGHISMNLEDKIHVINKLKDIIKNRTEEKIDCKFKLATGSYRWYSFYFFTVQSLESNKIETIGFGYDITELKSRENQLKYMSTQDPLTQTLNQAYFEELLHNISPSERQDLCLILLDINGLRWINDVLGRRIGDQLLSEVANVVKDNFKLCSSIAHMGGGKFGLIAYHSELSELRRLCEHTAQLCAETHQCLLPLNLSWAVAGGQEILDGDSRDLLHIAETRLLSHKALQKINGYDQVVFFIKTALALRSIETRAHLSRMEHMVKTLVPTMKLSSIDFQQLLLLAAIHDMGKLGLPDEILHQPGPLTEEEERIMHSHCEVGYRIALAFPELTDLAPVLLAHHERWDGTGYPHGLRGEEIPYLAQLIAVLDAYDIMTHEQVDKPAISHKQAVRELEQGKGSWFSPAAVDCVLNMFKPVADDEREDGMDIQG